MRLLLDTHIWLWAALEPERLSPGARDAMTRSGTELWLSPVSVWEAVVLAERGRLQVDGSPVVWVRSLLAATPRREAPLTHDVALASRALALSHEDPADRFIAATAQVYDLTLVTADARLLACPGVRLLPGV